MSTAASVRPVTGFLVALAVVTFAAASWGCGARYIRSSPHEPLAAAMPRDALVRNVILVSIDGLRPDAIGTFNAATLGRLIGEGSSTLAARTIMPSKTLPSHTSMLTGEPPEEHQVLWNNVTSAERDEIDLPNIFSVARAGGYRTAAFFSKAKFGPLQRAGTLDYSQAPGGWFGRWSSRRTIADVAEYLETARANLLFVHLTDPDAAGHRFGWMSAEYGRAVRAADSALGRLIELANQAYGPRSYALIVTADHGGHEKGHGSDHTFDVTIPWIAWGQGIRPGTLPPETVHTMDTASTVLWLLGLAEPADWAGTPVTQAFETGPAPSSSAGAVRTP